MNEIKKKIRIIVLTSIFFGLIALFFPQWYTGIYFAINISIPMEPNAREISLALSMFSISFLIVNCVSLITSTRKLHESKLFSFWTRWFVLGIMITLVPTLHMIVCYNLCINFWSFTILGLEVIFAYISGGLAIVAGLLAFNSKTRNL
jgi:hypothetical protein